MVGPKPILTEFNTHHRLGNCLIHLYLRGITEADTFIISVILISNIILRPKGRGYKRPKVHLRFIKVFQKSISDLTQTFKFYRALILY